jgi:hypothetical protein
MLARKRGLLWLFIFILGGIVGVLWLLERRWNQWFITTYSGRTNVTGVNGQVFPGWRITIQSILACSPNQAWNYANTSGFMHHVSWPLLRMQRIDDALPEEWSEGDSIRVKLSTLGVIPLGDHTIRILSVNPELGEIRSLESGRLIRALDHSIHIEPYGRNLTLYTDDVRVYAGLLTPLLAWGVRFFYRYRQSRWQSFARANEESMI